MKNTKVFLTGALVSLIILTTLVSAQTVTDDEYMNAYFVMYGDYLAGGDSFTKEELLDVIEYYLTTEDLSGNLNTQGSNSGELMGTILADAGINFDCGPCDESFVGIKCCIYRIGEIPVVYECIGSEVMGVTSYTWKELWQCAYGCCGTKCCTDPNAPTTTEPSITTSTTSTTSSTTSTTSTTVPVSCPDGCQYKTGSDNVFSNCSACLDEYNCSDVCGGMVCEDSSPNCYEDNGEFLCGCCCEIPATTTTTSTTSTTSTTVPVSCPDGCQYKTGSDNVFSNCSACLDEYNCSDVCGGMVCEDSSPNCYEDNGEFLCGCCCEIPATTSTTSTTSTTVEDDCQSHIDCYLKRGACFKCPTVGGSCVEEKPLCTGDSDCLVLFGSGWTCDGGGCCVPVTTTTSLTTSTTTTTTSTTSTTTVDQCSDFDGTYVNVGECSKVFDGLRCDYYTGLSFATWVPDSTCTTGGSGQCAQVGGTCKSSCSASEFSAGTLDCGSQQCCVPSGGTTGYCSQVGGTCKSSCSASEFSAGTLDCGSQQCCVPSGGPTPPGSCDYDGVCDSGEDASTCVDCQGVTPPGQCQLVTCGANSCEYKSQYSGGQWIVENEADPTDPCCCEQDCPGVTCQSSTQKCKASDDDGTNNGRDPKKEGTCADGSSQYPYTNPVKDTCWGNSVQEFYCHPSLDECIFEYIDCPSGYTCNTQTGTCETGTGTGDCSQACTDAGYFNYVCTPSGVTSPYCKVHAEPTADSGCRAVMQNDYSICCCGDCGNGICDDGQYGRKNSGESSLNCPQDCSGTVTTCEQACLGEGCTTAKCTSQNDPICNGQTTQAGASYCHATVDLGSSCCCENCGGTAQTTTTAKTTTTVQSNPCAGYSRHCTPGSSTYFRDYYAQGGQCYYKDYDCNAGGQSGYTCVDPGGVCKKTLTTTTVQSNPCAGYSRHCTPGSSTYFRDYYAQGGQCYYKDYDCNAGGQSGYTCVDPGGVCKKTLTTTTAMQCSSPAQCPTGYTCSGGKCVK